ncbi:MAG: SDR family oxidoreductase [Acidimicrobiales bacterium]|nr:SDR family oxidoreductase [Acidimicrobiales bacterium]
MPGPLSIPPAEPEPHDLLRGRRVVITAAAGTGIGFTTARRCLLEGASVLISDHHERRLGEAADRLADELGCDRPPVAVCDVTDEDQVQALFATAESELGGFDTLVNNAGLGGQVDLVDMTDDQWNTVLDVTLNGTMRCTRAAMRRLYASGGGVIVNNASVLGWRAQQGQAHYAAAKAGVMALTRAAAVEGADHGVRVNAVAPSIAMHPFLARTSSDELLDELTSREAYGRAAEPWEVATVIVFLASDQSSYMTGEIVSVSSQRA